MDWQVTRHTSVLWGFIQELQQDPKCSLFFDLTIYCSDGELPWNRLCLALSIPSCAAILNYDVPETEVAVSLADITMAELQTQLENCLPIKATIHPSLVPGGGKVSYNLVPAKPPMQNGDVGSDSDACAGDQLDPSDEENNSGILPKKRKEKLKKKCSKLKKKTKRRIQSESESGDDFNAGDVLDPSDEGESEVSKDGSEVENLEKNKRQKSKSKYFKYEKPAEFDSDEWEDFCGGGGGVSAGELSIGESDEEESSLDEDSESQTKSKRRRKASESESESEEDSPKRKRGPKRKRRVKKMAESSDEETESDEEEQPMVAINANDIKLEPGVEPKTKKKRPRGPKSRRKKKVKKKRRVKFDDDEDGDYDMAMSLAISGSEDSSEKEYDFGKIARSEKLTMDCRADVAKYELTENQLDDKMVIVRKTRKALRRPGRPVKKEKELPEPMEVKMEVVEEERIPVDITAGGVEEEAVAPLITKYQVGETVIKQCNTCPWSTDRKDKITIREHLFKHYPDVCGFACPVCRKPVKRKRELILHMERTHTPECLKLFGVEYMKQYEVGFDTNSEEQVNLR